MHPLRIFLFSGCLMLLAGCGQSPPDPEDIVGRYKGNYGSTLETIEVNEDGTFDQTLTWKDQTLHNHGTWKIEQLGLEFFHIYAAFDIYGKLRSEPELFSNMGAVWVKHKQFRRIAFNIECGYVLDRE